jgi:hypothetical protein
MDNEILEAMVLMNIFYGYERYKLIGKYDDRYHIAVMSKDKIMISIIYKDELIRHVNYARLFTNALLELNKDN